MKADITNTGSQAGTLDPSSIVDILDEGVGDGDYSTSDIEFSSGFSPTSDNLLYGGGSNQVYRYFTGTIPGNSTLTMTATIALTPQPEEGSARVAIRSNPDDAYQLDDVGFS